jgi:hypothetical protein
MIRFPYDGVIMMVLRAVIRSSNEADERKKNNATAKTVDALSLPFSTSAGLGQCRPVAPIFIPAAVLAFCYFECSDNDDCGAVVRPSYCSQTDHQSCRRHSSS